MNKAFVFPGQGSQKINMMDELSSRHAFVQPLFRQASEIFGEDLWALVTHGPEEKLNQTYYTQSVMLVADIAYFRAWCEENERRPTVVAGHSLGEYAALVAAEAISFEVALPLVMKRARLMQEAVQPGEGAMAAVLALTSEEVENICREVSLSDVMPANFNCPGQVVIAGKAQAVDAVIERVTQKGARAKKLPMSVPSHCHLMKPAAEKIELYLREVIFQSPSIPVINNVDVAIEKTEEKIKSALVRQLYSPVRWMETIEKIVNEFTQTILECGPGKVLTNMNKRMKLDIKF